MEGFDCERFIRAVRSKPTIWDQGDKNHHNRFILDRVWSEVASNCNIPREEARKKWKCLRDKFRIDLKKYEEEGGTENIAWPLFHSLLFLKDQFGRKRKSEANQATVVVKAEVTCEDENLDVQSVNSFYSSGSYNPTSPQESQFIDSFSRKRYCPEVEEPEVSESTPEVSCTKDLRHDNNLDDEDMHFFRSIAPHIRSLPSLKKIRLRMKIMEAVHEAISE